MFVTITSFSYIVVLTPRVWDLMQTNRLVTLQKMQADCAKSLCSVVQDLKFSCEVDDKQQGAKMIMDSLNGTTENTVRWSPVCQEAIQETEKILDAQAENENFSLASFFAMIQIYNDVPGDNTDNAEEGPSETAAAFSVIYPSNCSVSLLPASLFAGLNPLGSTPLADENDELGNQTSIDLPLLNPSEYKPGEVVENVLDLFLFPHAMSNNTSQVVEFFAGAHRIILGPKYPLILAVSIIAITTAVHCATLGVNTINLLFTTTLVRLFFQWPKDFCGRRTITFWSTYKMLLLLCTLSSSWPVETDGIIVAAVMAMTAYRTYSNSHAAMEWIQLGILWYGWSSLTPYLDNGENGLKVLDGLGIIRFVGGWIAYFIPGSGWWNLVRVYVFWGSFPRRTERKEGRVADISGMHLD